MKKTIVLNILIAMAASTIAFAQFDDLTIQTVTGKVSRPVFATSHPENAGRLYIVEQQGRIMIFENGTLNAAPFLDIRSRVTFQGEMGLLSMAFDPNFSNNRRFYVNYVNRQRQTIVARFIASDTNALNSDRGTETQVISINQPYSNHNGGQIQFSPNDGYLYIGMGDGGSGGDPLNSGQDLTSLLGKVLRLDVNTLPYTIPADNPFVNNATVRPEIWASGLRNPWRFSFDRETGDMYIGDVGQASIEEIDYQPGTSTGGENYGWNIKEGTQDYSPQGRSKAGLTDPIHEYGRSDGFSVSGGYVYRGMKIPSLRGYYLFADFGSNRIWGFKVVNGQKRNFKDFTSQISPGGGIAGFGEDASGELYICSFNGTVSRIISTAPQNASLKVMVTPQAAVDAGQRWQLTGESEWRDSGETVGRLRAGNVTVEFETVPGWMPIASKTATLKENQVTSLTASFIPITVFPSTDFNKDGKTEFGVYSRKNGKWIIPDFLKKKFGVAGAFPVPGDYSGNGKAQLAYFVADKGLWKIRRGDDVKNFGETGVIPVPADYNGDGKIDAAYYDPKTAEWFIQGMKMIQHGKAYDIPVPGDYNGDSKDDIAIFRPGTGEWIVHLQFNRKFGQNGDIPMPADYNGDGKVDFAVFRPSTGTWLFKGRKNAKFGKKADIPIVGDFDSDGRTDIAVYRPSEGQFILEDGKKVKVGKSGDIPFSGR